MEVATLKNWEDLKKISNSSNTKLVDHIKSNELDNFIQSQINSVNHIPYDLRKNYYKKIAEGIQLWKDKRVIFCGLARNCESKIDTNMHLINKISNYFKDYKIIIFENNSSDNTKSKINNHAKINSKLIKIGNDDGEEFLSGLEESRIIRMSKYRSKIQEYIKDNYTEYDYVILLDFDIKTWSIEGILTSLAWHDFDVMGSVSLGFGPYSQSYDGWTHYDRWAFKFHSWTEEFSIDQSILRWFNLWKPPVGGKPIQCLSVFGGLAIYKMEAYLAGEYGSRHPKELGNITCVEHAQFHYSMNQKGYDKIYLNPSQRSIIYVKV